VPKVVEDDTNEVLQGPDLYAELFDEQVDKVFDYKYTMNITDIIENKEFIKIDDLYEKYTFSELYTGLSYSQKRMNTKKNFINNIKNSPIYGKAYKEKARFKNTSIQLDPSFVLCHKETSFFFFASRN
jgi:hypothetical protein